MDIIIRQYTTDDKADVAEIAALSGQEPCSDESGFPNLQLVACIGNKIAGYICGDLKMAPDSETGRIVPVVPWEGYIYHLAVKSDYRRKGIGKRLLSSIINEYRKLNCIRVELCTGSSEAADFYTACGGTRCTGPEYTPPDGLEIEGGSFCWNIIGE